MILHTDNINLKKLAIEELRVFITAKVEESQARGWSYKTTENAPESFKDLKAQTVHKCMPIASYGCDTSIYGDAKTNEMFRFWHDVTHLELDEGFSKSGEYAVIKDHLQEARLYGLSALATLILKIDTMGQVDYYFRHKEFVNNQDAFLDTCLQRGMSLAIKVKH